MCDKAGLEDNSYEDSRSIREEGFINDEDLPTSRIESHDDIKV